MEELIKEINENSDFKYNDYVDFMLNYLSKNKLSSLEDVKHFTYFWLPKKLRYATENDIINLKLFLENICKDLINIEDLDESFIELSRIYNAKSKVFNIINDPVINGNKKLISLDNYIYKKNKSNQQNKDIATTYENSLFIVQEIKDGGQLILKSLSKDKEYKLLLEYPSYKYFKAGDILQAVIKRKIFYVFWEIEELIALYPNQSIKYLEK